MSNRGRHKKPKSKYAYSWISKILDDDTINKMLTYQKHQSRHNIVDLKVFEKHPYAGQYDNGFTWVDTEEGHKYWSDVLGKVNDYKIENNL
ncbi:MAG: hypothetical protein IJ341_09615 [Bacteroidales bacterium]|nr:hypothetical protein [Bacteroidales bacterium]